MELLTNIFYSNLSNTKCMIFINGTTVGRNSGYTVQDYFDGYMSHVAFVDGQL